MLGNRLKALRGKRTQEEIAKLIGVSRARYSHYENGRSEPDNETLQKLADLFNVTTDYLLGRTNIPNTNDTSSQNLKTQAQFAQHALTFYKSTTKASERLKYSEIANKMGISFEEFNEFLAGDKELSQTTLKIFSEITGARLDLIGVVEEKKNDLPSLTTKDERDIAKDLENIINGLDGKDGYSHFGGQSIEDMDEEDKDLLKASLENAMRLAKRMAKQKFTPKKYRE